MGVIYWLLVNRIFPDLAKITRVVFFVVNVDCVLWLCGCGGGFGNWKLSCVMCF